MNAREGQETKKQKSKTKMLMDIFYFTHLHSITRARDVHYANHF